MHRTAKRYTVLLAVTSLEDMEIVGPFGPLKVDIQQTSGARVRVLSDKRM